MESREPLLLLDQAGRLGGWRKVGIAIAEQVPQYFLRVCGQQFVAADSFQFLAGATPGVDPSANELVLHCLT